MNSDDATSTTITLRALEGRPLSDAAIRGMVEATANAIAERQGLRVQALRSEADRIHVTLPVGRLAAIGFAAELRRLTTRWYTQKFGAQTLWGEALEEGEEWKRA
ncbi:MAG TPA: hypothetical protein VMS30_08690 [Phycisphaerales bacterium]|jgi:hypothetical protein|nr:hypothetical protein [Phycisphaerales bacterium]